MAKGNRCLETQTGEVCKLQTAETILGIIRERGLNGLPLQNVYRLLFNPDLYLRAYGRIYRNDGAMTRGTTKETVDGMSLVKINDIIETIRFERYRWTPVRRVEIPKKNGKMRPLGIPTWSDKLLQEVMRSILEAYYEPQFCDHSHGFRPARGCHTALTEIDRQWTGTKWFVEGDIKGCFDNIDHSVLLSFLREKIQDNRFLRLVENLLKAGYLEDWNYKPTLSGTPQGGIISPLLANIYLDRLDEYVVKTLMPEYNKGTKRARNPEYHNLGTAAYQNKKRGNLERYREQKRMAKSIPSVITDDPDYRRLRYVRYADDFLLGVVGPKEEAEEIKEKLRTFLTETLRLELSEEKTLITHASTEQARFLGYDITIQSADTRRRVNGRVSLRVPISFIEERKRPYMKDGKPVHRSERMLDHDFSIVSQYQGEYRGYVQYYALADNIAWLSKLKWVMETSLLKTLAHKHKASVAQMVKKYATSAWTQHGPRRCLEVTIEREGRKPLVARFGALPLRRNGKKIIIDQATATWTSKRTELVKRLLADECEICGSTEHVEVHHIRKMADVQQPGRKRKPDWMVIMAARNRKTLVLCSRCHDDLHAGRPFKALSA